MKRFYRVLLALVALLVLLFATGMASENTGRFTVKQGQGQAIEPPFHLSTYIKLEHFRIPVDIFSKDDKCWVSGNFKPPKQHDGCLVTEEGKRPKQRNICFLNNANVFDINTIKDPSTLNYQVEPKAFLIYEGQAVIFHSGNRYLLIRPTSFIRCTDPEQEIPGISKVARYNWLRGYVPPELLPKGATSLQKKMSAGMEKRDRITEGHYRPNTAIRSMKYDWKLWINNSTKLDETKSAVATAVALLSEKNRLGVKTVDLSEYRSLYVAGVSFSFGVSKDPKSKMLHLNYQAKLSSIKALELAVVRQGEICDIDLSLCQFEETQRHGTVSDLDSNDVAVFRIRGKTFVALRPLAVDRSGTVNSVKCEYRRWLAPAVEKPKKLADASNVSSGL